MENKFSGNKNFVSQFTEDWLLVTKLVRVNAGIRGIDLSKIEIVKKEDANV